MSYTWGRSDLDFANVHMQRQRQKRGLLRRLRALWPLRLPDLLP